MGRKTKISWCDSTWSPVTGCLHGCEYCYARRIAKRFGAMEEINEAVRKGTATDEIFFVDEAERDKINVFYHKGSKINLGTLTGVNPEPCELNGRVWVNGKPNPYPFDFTPTFHRYRLDEPQRWKKPKTIFVCSMADLFGDWVPDEWIQEVFKACEAAPQHRYLFLTKNPKRYDTFSEKHIHVPENAWLGFSYDGRQSESWLTENGYTAGEHVFVSVEPITRAMTDFEIMDFALTDWCIIGAETGKRTGAVCPEKSWVMAIADKCEALNVPVFMKESLRDLMGDDFRQEFPWEV